MVEDKMALWSRTRPMEGWSVVLPFSLRHLKTQWFHSSQRAEYQNSSITLQGTVCRCSKLEIIKTWQKAWSPLPPISHTDIRLLPALGHGFCEVPSGTAPSWSWQLEFVQLHMEFLDLLSLTSLNWFGHYNLQNSLQPVDGIMVGQQFAKKIKREHDTRETKNHEIYVAAISLMYLEKWTRHGIKFGGISAKRN